MIFKNHKGIRLNFYHIYTIIIIHYFPELLFLYVYFQMSRIIQGVAEISKDISMETIYWFLK